MKTNIKTLAVAVGLVLSLVAFKAQAGGFGHSGGFSSHSMGASSGQNFSSAKASNFSKQANLGSQSFATKFKSSNNLTSANKGFKQSNKSLAFDKKNWKSNNKSFNCKKDWYHDWCFDCCYGSCGYGCGWWGSYDCCYPCYNYPCYYFPCYTYVYPQCVTTFPVLEQPVAVQPALAQPVADADSAPVSRVVRIANPASTKSTLAFGIGDQTYTLAAGETKTIELDADAAIAFDRGNGGEAAKYALTPGDYSFAATEKGWELFHSHSMPQAEGVASDN